MPRAGGASEHKLLVPCLGVVDEFSQTLVDQAAWAKGLGFTAAKLEILINGPYAHSGLNIPDSRMIETIEGVRRECLVRSTFVIDKKGVIRHAAYGINPRGHAMEVFDLVRRLRS